MDSFAFDKFWASVAPLQISGNATFVPPDYPTFFTMTQPKYLSTIPRDNIYRQFLSLWFITVCPWIPCLNPLPFFLISILRVPWLPCLGAPEVLYVLLLIFLSNTDTI